MKKIIVLIISVSAISCGNGKSEGEVTIQEKSDTLITLEVRTDVNTPTQTQDAFGSIHFGETDWQQSFGLTHNPEKDSIWFKPVSYYISDTTCSKLAIEFYYGRLRPSDDEATDKLLALATTSNDKMRPFYRWCLNKTMLIQDGALAEHTGLPARRYAERFPREFEYGYRYNG